MEMASSFVFFLLFSFLFIYTTPISYAQRFLPPGVILTVAKDSSTLRYTTQINQRSPHVPVKLTVDLGGNSLWVDCEQGFASSSYKPAPCRSTYCTLADAKACGNCNLTRRPGCNPNTCNLPTTNPVNGQSTTGEVAMDVVSVSSSDGKNLGKVVSLPEFLFVCGKTPFLRGHASGVKGVAGLGRTKIALPSQLSRRFVFPNKFGICLSSSSKGVIYFGGQPFFLLPGKEISSSLMYTPLLSNPSGGAGASSEYYVGVKSIKVSEKIVPINTALLSIKNDGTGGTKISTVTPYTVMESSIYNAVVKAFVDALPNKVPRVPAVAPFGACFNSKGLTVTRVGYQVPSIDFVFQSDKDYWRIFGVNSLVTVNRDVVCLGFVDGGKNPRTSIVIGGYQLEDNYVQFDLETQRVGFTSTLTFIQTTCANFNFTINPGIVA